MNKDQQRRSFDGIVFDSILEMRFYRDVIRSIAGERRYHHLSAAKGIRPATHVHLQRKSGAAHHLWSGFLPRLQRRPGGSHRHQRLPVQHRRTQAEAFLAAVPEITYRWLSYTQKTGWISYDELKKSAGKTKVDKGDKITMNQKKQQRKLAPTGFRKSMSARISLRRLPAGAGMEKTPPKSPSKSA